MLAWHIREGGESDEPFLECMEIPVPEPGPSEIRVRVSALGVNRADLLQVQGRYPPPPGFDPRIPGLEYAGVIDAVGERVVERRAGEPAMGLVPGGAYAEYVVTTEREAIPVPAGLSLTEAAAVPEPFLTAYRALVLEAGMASGDTILIRPVTAGVGLAAARLARALGARVIGISRSVERLEQVQAMGIDPAFALVDDGNGIAERIEDAVGGVDVALDMVAGASLNDTLASLNTEGRAVMIGLLGGMKTKLKLGPLLMNRGALKAMTMRAQPLEERIRVARAFQQHLTPLFEAGELQPDLAQTFPFREAPAAHETMARNEHPGRLVLTL